MSRRMKQDLVAGLDMGSGRVTCLIGVSDSATGGIKVLGGSSVACRGLKGGVVIDIIDAASAVTRSPFFLARRTASIASAVEICST